ncbi:origin recognition complex subunit 4 C-terminus-domain-containing protein [Spinellus fusiger]|nr:origin recognition complex subunit 4 C-terminus-domain-containing protein [Spinellus fusiger]
MTNTQENNHECPSPSELHQVRHELLSRLSETKLGPLRGLTSQYDQLYQLLHQTATVGESNSCLLIGNRGTGKTALVQSVLDNLQKEKETSFCVVYLNGLTATTDRLALNEIARQLAAQQQQQHTNSSQRSFSSFSESFDYILSLLKAGNKQTLPVIFILDEFDQFTLQPKQTLLYNLLDTVQSAQSPLAVVGLTCRLDTLELLEKRVKSRFSHRQIYLFPPATFGDFVETAKSGLCVSAKSSMSSYYEEFNQSIETLFQDPTIYSLLRRIFDISKDLRMFYKICFGPVSVLSCEQPFLSVESLHQASITQHADCKTELLKGVSLLELVLIISMKKLIEKDIRSFNFQMVYDEYKDFMNRTQVRGLGFGMKLYKPSVALKAFENLQSFEIVCPTDSISKCPKEYRMTKLMLEGSQVTETVLKYKDCPSIVYKWEAGAA